MSGTDLNLKEGFCLGLFAVHILTVSILLVHSIERSRVLLAFSNPSKGVLLLLWTYIFFFSVPFQQPKR